MSAWPDNWRQKRGDVPSPRPMTPRTADFIRDGNLWRLRGTGYIDWSTASGMAVDISVNGARVNARRRHRRPGAAAGLAQQLLVNALVAADHARHVVLVAGFPVRSFRQRPREARATQQTVDGEGKRGRVAR